MPETAGLGCMLIQDSFMNRLIPVQINYPIGDCMCYIRKSDPIAREYNISRIG